jgi:hypothetical protein
MLDKHTIVKNFPTISGFYAQKTRQVRSGVLKYQKHYRQILWSATADEIMI